MCEIDKHSQKSSILSTLAGIASADFIALISAPVIHSMITLVSLFKERVRDKMRANEL